MADDHVAMTIMDRTRQYGLANEGAAANDDENDDVDGDGGAYGEVVRMVMVLLPMMMKMMM